MYRDRAEISTILNSVCIALKEVAMEDNEITQEEQAILDIVNTGISNLEDQILQMLESELDENEFVDLVTEVFNDIIKNVVNEAKLDGIITTDEQKLIDKLRSFVKEGGIFNVSQE
ncbi:MAG: hypothetical protein D6732_16080 [Methanobacteriota archaeon]|nr:MAG: hypothetical protein D6732_16080 [Euryarchaeota archaeon]